MFRRSNSGELFFLRRETDSMKIATNFEAWILGVRIVDL